MNEKINHAWIPQVVKLDEIHKNERFEIIRNDGYIFKDENGNVINATKIVLEKKTDKDMPEDAVVEFYHYNIGYAKVYKVHYNEELNKIELC